MPRRLPVTLGSACLLLAGLVAPVGSITAQAEPLTQTESLEIESRVSPQSGTPSDGVVGSWSAVAGGLDGPVNAFAFWDDTLVAGGGFQKTSDGTIPLNYVGAFDPTDDTWLPMGPSDGPGFNTSSSVRTLSTWDDTLVAGGTFGSTYDGSIQLNFVAAFDPTDDTWLPLGPPSAPGFNFFVNALTTWDDTLVAGGEFGATSDQSVDLNFIATFDPTDDTWTTVGPSGDPGLDDNVQSLNTWDGDLVVGGQFEESTSGTDLEYVGGISVSDGEWIDFDGGLSESSVFATAVDDTRALLYVGGDFGTADARANGVAVYDAGVDEWLSFQWGPSDDSVGLFNESIPFSGRANALALDDSAIYVGGSFSEDDVETAGANNIARWTWDPPAGDGEYTGAPGQRVRIVGEGFIGMTADDTPTIGGVQVSEYSRVSANEISVTIPANIPASADIEVSAIGGTGIVGSFTMTPASTQLGEWSSLASGLDQEVKALELWNDSLIAGGVFSCANGGSGSCDVPLNFIGMYSSTDDTWVPMGSHTDPGLSNVVYGVTIWDDTVVAGGSFLRTDDNSILLNHIGAYASGDDTWVSLGQGPGVPAWVEALTTWDDSLVAGGWNLGAGTEQVVLLESATNAPVPLGPAFNNTPVRAVVSHDDTLFAGGGFTSPDGVAAYSRLDPLWRPVGGGLNAEVRALAMSGVDLVAGGDFTGTADAGVELGRIGRYSSGDDTWNPLGDGLDSYVYGLGTDDERNLVYAGGEFGATGGGQPQQLLRIGAWDAHLAEWIPLTFAGGSANGIDDTSQITYVSAIAPDDSVVYVGGFFPAGISGRPGTNNVARWRWDPPQGANSLSAAGGATVTITGAGFIGMSPTDTVRFGSTPVTSLTRISSTQLEVVVPPGTFTNAPIYVDAVGGRGQVGTFSSSGSPTPDPIPSPSSPPSAPVGVTALAGDARATIRWTAPASSGSFPVTRYEVRSTPAGGTCLVATLTCTITGLTNGTAYTFEARALNGAGWGPWSTRSNTVTPVAPPPPPSITITGSRGTGAERQVIFVTGTSTGLDGEQVRAHVKLRGQAAYRPGRFVDVTDEGRFGWQRTTGKKTYVYFTGGGVQSNRVIIPAARR